MGRRASLKATKAQALQHTVGKGLRTLPGPKMAHPESP